MRAWTTLLGALLVVLAAVALLALTVLASLLPGTAEHLKKCAH